VRRIMVPWGVAEALAPYDRPIDRSSGKKTLDFSERRGWRPQRR